MGKMQNNELTDSNIVEDSRNAKQKLNGSNIKDSQNAEQELDDRNNVEDIKKNTEKIRDEEESCKKDIN